MSDIAIKIEDLSKQYRLGSIGTGTLSNDMKRWWYKVRGKEDPALEIGKENILSEVGGEYVYALKDINLEVKHAEIIGVIGKNGAGKSTLLKILSRVTAPTTGTIDIYGRVASLLEVGTGFNSELTGRENVFLNGAILGMSKLEIRNKFDEIVEFAGVGKYIDTPVKRYSSGMYVRLGFAVAAYLEPEILIVDEVLAVGDADFQKKAIGKMQDVSRNHGRTVLFVSHNMSAIKNLCKTGILIDKGKIKYSGDANSTVNEYLKQQEQNHNLEVRTIQDRTGNGTLRIINALFKDSAGEEKTDFLIDEPFQLEVFFEKKIENKKIFASRIDICINDSMNNVVTWMSTYIFESNYLLEKNSVTFIINNLMLNHGSYDLTIYSEINNLVADRIQNIKKFNVLFNDYYKTGKEIQSGQCSLVSNFKIR